MSESRTGERVKLVDLIGEEHPAYLRDITFRDCEIIGPAVLMPDDTTKFRRNRLTSACFWVVDSGRAYEGGIGLIGCLFEGCTFTNVGIAGPLSYVEAFFG